MRPLAIGALLACLLSAGAGCASSRPPSRWAVGGAALDLAPATGTLRGKPAVWDKTPHHFPGESGVA